MLLECHVTSMSVIVAFIAHVVVATLETERSFTVTCMFLWCILAVLLSVPPCRVIVFIPIVTCNVPNFCRISSCEKKACKTQGEPEKLRNLVSVGDLSRC